MHDGIISAVGAFGQLIYFNPAEQVVAVLQGAWRKPEDIAARLKTVMLLRAAVRALQEKAGP